MENFLSAKVTIQRLRIRPFQLLELMKEGRLHAYTADTGDLVVDYDSLELLPSRTLESCRLLTWSKMREEEEKIIAALDIPEDLSPWFSVSNADKWEKAKMIYFLLQNAPESPDTIESLGSIEGEPLFIDYHAWSPSPKSAEEAYDKLDSLIDEYKKWKWEAEADAEVRRRWNDKQLDRRAEEYYYSQPWTRTAPPNCVAVSLSEKKTAIDMIMTCLFPEIEVEALREGEGSEKDMLIYGWQVIDLLQITNEHNLVERIIEGLPVYDLNYCERIEVTYFGTIVQFQFSGLASGLKPDPFDRPYMVSIARNCLFRSKEVAAFGRKNSLGIYSPSMEVKRFPQVVDQTLARDMEKIDMGLKPGIQGEIVRIDNQADYFPDEINKAKLAEYAEDWGDAWPYINKILLYKTKREVADIDKITPSYTLLFVVDDIEEAVRDNTFPYNTLIPIQNTLYNCGHKVDWNLYPPLTPEGFGNLADDPMSDFIYLNKQHWSIYQRDAELDSNMETTVTAAVSSTENTESVLKKHLSKAGQKGGAQSKLNKAILEAVRAYMRDKTETFKWSNQKISDGFCKTYKDSKPRRVAVDDSTWEVYCHDRLIFSRKSASTHPTNEEKSIKYSTFRDNYIAIVKNEILDKNSHVIKISS